MSLQRTPQQTYASYCNFRDISRMMDCLITEIKNEYINCEDTTEYVNLSFEPWGGMRVWDQQNDTFTHHQSSYDEYKGT